MMMLIIKLLVTFVAFIALLYLLSRFIDDFSIKPGGLISVALILLPVSYILGWILKILAFPFNFITLGLLSFFFGWLINTAVMWATDRFSEQLTISKTSTFFISGAALSLCQWLIKIIMK